MKIFISCLILQVFTLVFAKEKTYMANLTIFKEIPDDCGPESTINTNEPSKKKTSVFQLPVYIDPSFIKFKT